MTAGMWPLEARDIRPGASPRWYRCRRCGMRSRRVRFVLRGRRGCEWCRARREAGGRA